jgi:hypothetical protein
MERTREYGENEREKVRAQTNKNSLLGVFI